MNYILANLVSKIFQIFSVLILVEVIASWILAMRVRLPLWAYNILQAIHTITAPVLDPIRRVMPSMGGLDLSPIIALFLLQILGGIIVNALRGAY